MIGQYYGAACARGHTQYICRTFNECIIVSERREELGAAAVAHVKIAILVYNNYIMQHVIQSN